VPTREHRNIEHQQEQNMARIGILGGSGLEKAELVQNAEHRTIETPHGPTSSPMLFGEINGVEVAVIHRHGSEHTITPTHVNNRANIWAMKQHCDALLATTAVGSLQQEMGRGDLVIVDQFIDFTRRRVLSFHDEFEPGNAVHTPMATPFDAGLSRILASVCCELNLPHHPAGTVVTIEGPRFSTIAESKMFRSWGADIINMSVAPECALANEVQLPYAAVAMVTDYDCWKTDEAPVTWDDICKVFGENVAKISRLITQALPEMAKTL
jgi:5'-methylthioadenosine phosphorylase